MFLQISKLLRKSIFEKKQAAGGGKPKIAKSEKDY